MPNKFTSLRNRMQYLLLRQLILPKMNANDGIDAMLKLIKECSVKIRLGNKVKI
jgi:hypothetical protein